MKIVLTGSSGQLGGFIKTYCDAHHIGTICISHKQFDQLSLAQLDMTHVDAIVHCAAMTNVEVCEDAVVDTLMSNLVNPSFLIDLATAHNIPFVYISSVGIYGDDPMLTPETADVENTTVHHASKFFFEELLRLKIKQHLILRTGWVFSDRTGAGKNFIERILSEAATGQDMVSNDEQFGHPTSARFVTETLFSLLRVQKYGVYNTVQNPSLSRYEYVKLILKYAGSRTPLAPVPAAHFNRKARVNQYETATNKKLAHASGTHDLQFYGDLELTVKSILAQ